MINERILKMSVHEAELTLASVKADTEVELVKIREARKIQKEEYDEYMLKMQPEKDRLAVLLDDYASQRAENASERERIALEKEWHVKAVEELKTQNRLALKDLSWVNDKVLKAEELIKNLHAEILSLEKIILEKQALADRIKAIDIQVQELESKKAVLSKEISLMQGNAHEYMTLMRAELETTIEKRDKAVSERNQAQYEMKTFTDELVTKKKDFAIYVQRLEEHYEEAFPELKVNL